MLLPKRIVLLAVLTVGSSLSGADAAHAQLYPQKLIKIVVPGLGPGDVLARVTARLLQSTFRQSVVVENVPGAGGVLAARMVARAVPDGHTLLFGNTGVLAAVPATSKSPGYTPERDFAPVAKIADTFLVLVVEATHPSKSAHDLIEHARANPGRLNFGAGYGNVPHLAGELLKSSVGIDIVHVPYKTETETITAVLGGQVQLAFTSIITVLPLIHQGKLRALAVTSANRQPELPDVPTMIESGVAGHVVNAFFGIVAPAATPPSVVTRLNGTINQGLRSPEMQATLARLGAQASPGTAQEFANLISSEARKWAAVATAARIKID